jgi:hypothetical protein
MAIKITIGDKSEQDPEEKPKGEIKYKLNIRKTLDGNLIIYDHEDLDIVVIPEKRKVLALSNDNLNTDDKVYDTQNRFFKFLTKKAVISPETIHSGNVYGSMEAQYPVAADENVNETDIVLMVISEWLEEERPNFLYRELVKDREVDRLTDPENTETTPLGKVPHDDTGQHMKSIPPTKSMPAGYR